MSDSDDDIDFTHDQIINLVRDHLERFIDPSRPFTCQLCGMSEWAVAQSTLMIPINYPRRDRGKGIGAIAICCRNCGLLHQFNTGQSSDPEVVQMAGPTSEMFH